MKPNYPKSKPQTPSRPAKKFDDRPPRTYEERPAKKYDDRPARNYDERPAKKYDDRPARNYDERPAKKPDARPVEKSVERPLKPQSEASHGKGSPDEIKMCGYNACQKLYESRAEDIIRVYLVQTRLEEFSELVKSCVRRRKAYHVVTVADMDKISGSTHHEGVCIIAKRRLPPTWDLFLSQMEDDAADPTLVLILEDVANPHNIGAILRSAANFGCKYVVLPNEKSFKPSAALLRTAEGGGEFVEFVSAPSINVIATELRQRGITVLGTAMKGRINLYQNGEAGALPPRLAVILGNEARGLSADAKKAAAGMIAIPGTGAVQSLNVGMASALIAGEYFRQHGLNR